MWRRLLRWFAPVLIAGFVELPAAFAQSTNAIGEGGDGRRSAAIPYTVAFLFTLLVLVIVCTPSRKAIRE
jgi:hypothetical protein